MRGHLFFQGPIRIGKSTYLRDEINRKSSQVCGFSVQRIIDNGQAVGYQATTVCRSLVPPVDVEYRTGLPGIFLLDGKKDITVLERAIFETELMLADIDADFVFLDEIGGMELISEAFMTPLLSILTKGVPCIGIIKSQENLAHTVSKMQMQKKYQDKRSELVKLIEDNGEIVSITKDSVDTIETRTALFWENCGYGKGNR